MQRDRIIVVILVTVSVLGVLQMPLEGASLEKIDVSYGAISGSMAPIWVAKEARIFKKQGLEPNLVYIPGGPRSVMALLGGSVQFVNHSAMPSLEAYQRGADTVLIASPMNRLDHSLVVQPHITKVEDLRGKIVGISSLGSLTDVVLREGLRLNGLSERDMTILPVGDLSARLGGLRTGRIHGAMVAGVQDLAATKMGFRQLIDFSKLPIEVSGSSILSRRSYVFKNQDTTLRFLKAWIEGIYIFKTNPEFSLATIRRFVGTQDSQVLESIYARYRDKLLERPLPSVGVVKSMLDLLSRSSSEAHEVNPDGFVEGRLMNELERSGFFEEMSRQYRVAQKRRD